MFRRLFFLLLFFSVQGLAAQSGMPDLDTLDAYIEQARRQWKVPGLAVAVVRDGAVVFQKGYGQRQMDRPEPVDPRTIFAVASTTKAMTAAAMGMLVDEGKLRWDDRVIDHLPEFQLQDPYASRELRIRDLFTHNAGLGNADFLWAGNDLEPSEILHRMRFAAPAYPFRGGYTYQNIMYLVAGQVIARVSGASWEDFITERLFKPLGMTRTFANRQRSAGETNRAVPHDYVDEQIRPVSDFNADAIAPAGAAWSCVEDMAKWARFMLDSARVDGHPLLKPQTWAELLRPQIVIPPGQFYPTVELTRPHWTTYALGWFQHDYQGRFVSFHTGSLSGTVAIIGLIPDEKLGVYVLGNLDHAEVRHALMYKIFDLFGPGGPSRDWSTDLLSLYTGLRDKAKTQREKALGKRVQGTRPSLALPAYEGTFEDPFYGKAVVTLDKGTLHLRLSTVLSGRLTHWHYDTFLAEWSIPGMEKSLVTFDLDEVEGRIIQLKSGRQIYRKK